MDFERVACLTFVNKGIVREQLTHHIRPLYYRQKYGIPVHNPLATDVQKMYPMTYEFTRRAAIMAGMPSLSTDELGYLTIYLSADLDNRMLEEGDTSASKVLMVDATNMSMATLVREQLVDACGIQFEFDYTEPSKLHRWDLDGYALVLALTPLPVEMHSDNMVEVAPFLSEENKQQIYHILRNNRIISRYNGLIEGIVGIVEKALPEADRSILHTDRIHFELFRFFDDRDRGLSDTGSSQCQDAHIEGTYVTVPAGLTWQQMTLAGAEALQGGVGTSRFAERMKNIVSGPRFLYYRMNDSPDVVIVRCPMQGDDNAHVAAQIVVSPDGVEFPDGLLAKVVVCIATINRYSHWGTLFNVYRYLSDPKHVCQIKAECSADLMGDEKQRREPNHG